MSTIRRYTALKLKKSTRKNQELKLFSPGKKQDAKQRRPDILPRLKPMGFPA